MTALAGPLHLLALVLVVSGIGKLADPWPATGAMRDAGLPVPFRGRAVGGRALGVAEIAVGLAGLAVTAWWAAASIAVVYAGFAAFVVRLRRRDEHAGCGCFGAAGTPPGRIHLALNLTATAVGIAAALIGVPDIVDIFDEGLGTAVPYVLLLAIGAALVLVGPSLAAALEETRAGARPRPFGPTSAGRTA